MAMRPMPVMSELQPPAAAAPLSPTGTAAASQSFTDLLAQALFRLFGGAFPQQSDLATVFPELAGELPAVASPTPGAETALPTPTETSVALDPAAAFLIARLASFSANLAGDGSEAGFVEPVAWNPRRGTYGAPLPGGELLQEVLRTLHGHRGTDDAFANTLSLDAAFTAIADVPLLNATAGDVADSVVPALLSDPSDPDAARSADAAPELLPLPRNPSERIAFEPVVLPLIPPAASESFEVMAAPASEPARSTLDWARRPEARLPFDVPAPGPEGRTARPAPVAETAAPLVSGRAADVTNGLEPATTAEIAPAPRGAAPPLSWLPQETRIEPVAVRLDAPGDVAGMALRAHALSDATRSAGANTLGGPSAGDVSASVLAQLDRYEFVGRITQALERAHAQAPKSLEIQLHPPSLGRLRIHVGTEQGEWVARIESPSQAVRAVLVEQLPILGKSLAEHGIQIQRFHVDDFPMGSSSNGQTGGQSTGQQDGGQQQRWDGRSHAPPRPQAHNDHEPLTIDQLWALAPGMNRLV